jgi:hypothetical protein
VVESVTSVTHSVCEREVGAEAARTVLPGDDAQLAAGLERLERRLDALLQLLELLLSIANVNNSLAIGLFTMTCG